MNNELYVLLGASSDIGLEVIRQLNEEKDGITIVAQFHQSKDRLDLITPVNNNIILPYRVDLSIEEQVTEFIKYLKDQNLIPTHILHLPGLKFQFKKLSQVEFESLQQDFDIQVKSLVNILQGVLPAMLKKEPTLNKKIVIMLSSNTISLPPKYTMQYNIVKYALLGVVKSLASDFSKKKLNVNGISPSMVETKFLSEIDERLLQMTVSNSVQERFAKVEEIVPTIKFLLSQESNYINGVNVNISNGNVN